MTMRMRTTRATITSFPKCTGTCLLVVSCLIASLTLVSATANESNNSRVETIMRLDDSHILSSHDDSSSDGLSWLSDLLFNKKSANDSNSNDEASTITVTPITTRTASNGTSSPSRRQRQLCKIIFRISLNFFIF